MSQDRPFHESRPTVRMNEIDNLERLPRSAIAIAAMALTLGITWIDYVTGPFVPLAAFQALPIFLAACFPNTVIP